jgi:uncharacterized protein involved in exopolysaccharide biosynthesis
LTLIKSRLVLDAALQDENVRKNRLVQRKKDPIMWLQDNLNVEFVPGTEVMEISLRGDNPKELAGVVNAVKKAYMDEVVNVDARRRADRHAQLKKIKQNYTAALNERRSIARELSENAERSELLPSLVDHSAPRLFHDLRTQRVQLRLERAEAETLLARRKKSAAADTDPIRKEIAQLEDRLAVVTARQTVLDDELERVTHQMRGSSVQALDLKEIQEDIAHMQDAYRKVSAEIEALNIELEAPPRVRVIEDAVSPPQ